MYLRQTFKTRMWRGASTPAAGNILWKQRKFEKKRKKKEWTKLNHEVEAPVLHCIVIGTVFKKKSIITRAFVVTLWPSSYITPKNNFLCQSISISNYQFFWPKVSQELFIILYTGVIIHLYITVRQGLLQGNFHFGNIDVLAIAWWRIWSPRGSNTSPTQ